MDMQQSFFPKRPQDYKTAAEIPRTDKFTEDGFNIKIERSKTEFCIVEDLVVNGKNIFIFDLGIIKDIEPENAPPCGCGHRAFVPKPPVDDVLKKLDMDKEEYSRLCAVLQRHLDFGLCKRCR